MSQRKADNYASDILNGIMRESREQRAYELGIAYGWFNFYVYIKNTMSKDDADKIFNSILVGSENVNTYFRKLIELYEEDNTVVDDILDKFRM